MNERGNYGTTRWMIGADPTPRQPAPPETSRWGSLLGAGLSIGFLGALGYTLYGLVKSEREWDREVERERKIVAQWPLAKRDKWSESGLTVDAFEDWLKTGQGMTVSEWIRATPEKGR